MPDCGAYPGCDACIVDEQCAWCVSAKTCLTVEETFKMDCRGVIFDAIDGVGCPAFMTPGELSSAIRAPHSYSNAFIDLNCVKFKLHFGFYGRVQGFAYKC